MITVQWHYTQGLLNIAQRARSVNTDDVLDDLIETKRLNEHQLDRDYAINFNKGQTGPL